MSSFRNANAFDKELNLGSEAVRRYSISVNPLTLDKLLTKLTEEVPSPEQEEEHLRAVSVVGKNIGIGGEPIWCLNRQVSLGRDGMLVTATDHGLVWISHLTEPTSKGEIADQALSAKVEGEQMTAYFDAMAHLLAGSLEEKLAADTMLRCVASELFGDDKTLAYKGPDAESIDSIGQEEGESSKEEKSKISNIKEMQKDNFLSQFYLASMGVIMANYQEVIKLNSR